MSHIYLHGGGDNEASRQDTFGRFATAAMSKADSKLALLIAAAEEADAQESWQAYRHIFTAVHVPEKNLVPLFATATQPLTAEMLAQVNPSGLFVCGGMTPYYHQAICADLSWLAYLRESDIPYGGTSAGAAVAATNAILGGWQATRQEQSREMLFSGAGEGIDPLTVRPGLALVPFAVDVHASQMGTLTRLIHAVELGLVAEGWAIDENTMLVVNGRQLQIFGQGHCYRVWREVDRVVKLSIHIATEMIKR
ncbi:MAG: hypothetical protein HC804_13530 [Anaerolineae bacterium]|nr:hypothetical protein [Anaerolineae bacterium]